MVEHTYITLVHMQAIYICVYMYLYVYVPAYIYIRVRVCVEFGNIERSCNWNTVISQTIT